MRKTRTDPSRGWTKDRTVVWTGCLVVAVLTVILMAVYVLAGVGTWAFLLSVLFSSVWVRQITHEVELEL